MATLNITRNYQDGEVFNEAQLDAALDSIETFMNITGISAENIQDNSISAAELQTNSVTETKLGSGAVTTAKVADGAVTMAKLAAALQAYLVPTSTILSYGGDSAPAGFLLCDGTAVSRTDYATLFAVVGVRFGSGDGTSTFNTPDLRGRFLRGRDAGAGRDPDVGSRTAMNPGGATGNNVGSVQDHQFQSHTHTSGFLGSAAGSSYPAPTAGGGLQTQVSSANGGNETRPINAYVQFIIKT